MLHHRCLRLQTELVDQLLPELLQQRQNGVINFNNSKQLDILLRHLELSFSSPTFNVIPSITVIHILFTLAIRAPSLNWSHDLVQLESFVTSEYMKQVNRRYDSVLYHELLQKRAAKILRKYVDFIDEESNIATSMLHDRLTEVVATFFPASHLRPSIGRQTKNAHHNPAEFGDTSNKETPSLYAVEVISDSEESDAIVDEDHSLLLPESIKAVERSVLSFTDLGNRTSGLGETAVLFRDMPHLLAQVTPEPFDSDEPKPKRQKHLLIDQIQLFDDNLLFKRLQGMHQYNIWNIIRWCFWCADLSSQYQNFLFNSNQTKVHEIFSAYNDTLTLILHFCLLNTQTSKESSIWLAERLFSSLGIGVSVYDRAIEFIFTGLGISSNDEPKPYFPRERILVKTDASTNLSQCKEKAIFDDNTTSMNLRLLLLRCLYSVDTKLVGKEKIVSELLVEKIYLLSSANLRKLLASSLEQVVASPYKCAGALKFDNLLLAMCSKYIEKITDLKVFGEKACAGDELLLVLADGRVFTNFINSSLLDCFEVFHELWKKLIYLSGWLTEFVLSKSEDLSLDAIKITLSKFAAVKIDVRNKVTKESKVLKSEGSESLEPEEEFFTPCLDHSETYINVDDSLENELETSDCIELKVEGDESLEELTHNWSTDEVASCLDLFEKHLCKPEFKY